jgi:hypothetical protein
MFGKTSIRALSHRGIAIAAAALWAGFPPFALGDEIKVTLGGDQEIPPVATAASGTGTFTIGPDKVVSGSVRTTGVVVSVAHVHEAPPGMNGPIVFPLTRTLDAVWTVPAGVKLTDAQFESYKAGKLYFNMHSDAHKGGEIRGQIRP